MAMQIPNDDVDFLTQCYLVCCERLKISSSRKSFLSFLCATAPKHNYDCSSISTEGPNDAVFEFKDQETGVVTTLAVKKYCSTAAEIDIFKSLQRRRHPSIAPFNVKQAHGAVFVVAAYSDLVADLRSYVAALAEADVNYSNEVKKWMKQLVKGVKFLHGKGIMHRDLNPNNIFMTKDGGLKIRNFGKATRFGKEAEKHPYDREEKEEAREGGSTTRALWYRAPELLKEVKAHSSEVDMWSVGCIMAELVLNKVMFRGKDEKDQVDVILRVVTFRSLGEEPQWNEEQRNQSQSMSYAKYLLCKDGFDLLSGLLTINPAKRITAKAALNHAWFLD